MKCLFQQTFVSMVAKLCVGDCKALRWPMQSFALADAMLCVDRCNALRLGWSKLLTLLSKTKIAALQRRTACFFCLLQLLAEAEGLDDGTIAVDVAIVEVIEQCTALSYQLCQRTCGSIIFTVLLEVLRQMGNTV